jgi:hypothetical protein
MVGVSEALDRWEFATTRQIGRKGVQVKNTKLCFSDTYEEQPSPLSIIVKEFSKAQGLINLNIGAALVANPIAGYIWTYKAPCYHSSINR